MNQNQEDKERYKVKALSSGYGADSYILHGYFMLQYGNIPCVSEDGITEFYEINPYSLCKNTNIKKGDAYLYENDLVLFKNGTSNEEMGVIVWDNYRQSYAICTDINRTSTVELRKYNIEIIGNISLSDDDFKKFNEYSINQNGNYPCNQNTECRSIQRMNKLAREHLPR